jgi:hypothetical protein
VVVGRGGEGTCHPPPPSHPNHLVKGGRGRLIIIKLLVKGPETSQQSYSIYISCAFLNLRVPKNQALALIKK